MNPQDSFIWTTLQPESFWARKRTVVLKNTIPFQLDMLKSTGRYDAFDLQRHPIYDDEPATWPVPKHLFWDSDVGKWIEGLAYFGDLEKGDDSSLDQAAEDLVQKINKAQQGDGYVNIHFTVVAPKERFSNLRDMHELYNAGHLIEAALAHQLRFKSDQLMKPLEKYIELLHKTFGSGEDQIHGYPGHPEIELALIRFYKRTGNEKAVQLARYFVEERGNTTGANGRHYFDVEAEARGESEHTAPSYYPAARSYWYNQAHKPILEQETIEGHSVRAMYLLTAVADLAVLDPKTFGSKYLPALRRLWSNMVNQKMYLTGGIGAIKQWEGFGINYFLPQSTDEGGCYSETCAAIGVMMLAERILQIDLNGQYTDILERALYNAMLTGMSVDGKAFTYVNQMATSEEDASNRREEWFECACCPPNIARVLGHIGGYLWTAKTNSQSSATVNVHLYASASINYTLQDSQDKFKLSQKTNYPWEGTVDFELENSSGLDIEINVRIPSWAGDAWDVTPKPSSTSLNKHYLHLDAAYLKQNPQFKLTVPLTPRLLRPHPYTLQRIAVLARGPLIYCVEDVDHPWVVDHFKSLETKTDLPLGEPYIGITLKNGGLVLPKERLAPALEVTGLQALIVDKSSVDLHFVPYWARANRGGKHQMRVGIRTLD
ncbi:DUF1680-domain-containing protein [Cryphonectria parasitica EP155]|uniref:DUF1680-domain-containing protein n=1 Tax=Cryphonectria parasitica (strain ATCC 38755 / EP155) TaxID=660469 RepID=A0A9P4XS52_CRYP1|nr:DUF1680-domain-containing protein [Cryphonectria parasitica EP155]KAF3759897.1 DUF1680-domain-containing protein [Cryphonectria parasitica EP155]